MSKVTCGICSQTFQGATYDWHKFVGKDRTKLVLGSLAYQCKNCGAGFCVKCQEKHLKLKIRSGWEKVLCPQCGDSFGPGSVFVRKAASLVFGESTGEASVSKATLSKISRKLDDLWQEYYEGMINDISHNQEVLDLLKSHGWAFVQKTMEDAYGALLPAKQCRAVHRLGALGAIGALWLVEDGRVEDFLIDLVTSGYLNNGRPAVLLKQGIPPIDIPAERGHQALLALVPIEAVRKTGKSVPLFIDSLRDTQFTRFVRLLGYMYPDRRLVDAMIVEFENTHRPPPKGTGLLTNWELSVQEEAVLSLIKIGDERGLAAVVSLLLRKDKFAEYTFYSVKTRDMLKQMGQKAVDALVEALRVEDAKYRQRAATALGEIGDPRAVEPLIAMFMAGNVPGAAAQALGRLGDVRAVEPLLNAVKGPKGGRGLVRLATVESALRQIISKQTEQTSVSESLIRALTDENPRLRMFAAKGLGMIGGESAVGALTEVLKDKDRKVQKAARKALRAAEKKGA